MNGPPVYPHGPVEQIADDVFMVRGSIRMNPVVRITRNMAIVRNGSELTLVNPIRLSPAGEAELEALREVTTLVPRIVVEPADREPRGNAERGYAPAEQEPADRARGKNAPIAQREVRPEVGHGPAAVFRRNDRLHRNPQAVAALRAEIGPAHVVPHPRRPEPDEVERRGEGGEWDPGSGPPPSSKGESAFGTGEGEAEAEPEPEEAPAEDSAEEDSGSDY